MRLQLQVTCLSSVHVVISYTHSPRPSLSIHSARLTNRGMKCDPARHSCPADSPPCTRTSPRLPAGNWGFQGRRLNSSFWLCWGRGCRSFSSSLFLGQGCERDEQKKFPWWQLSVAVIKVWLSTERTAVEAGAVWVIVPPQIKLWLFRFPKLLKELWFLLPCLFMLRPLAPSRTDKSETWVMFCLCILKSSWEELYMDEPTAYYTQTHTDTHTDRTGLTYFPRAKHSSFTADSFAAGTESGKWTSILGSYSPITPARGRQEMTSFSHRWLTAHIKHKPDQKRA